MHIEIELAEKVMGWPWLEIGQMLPPEGFFVIRRSISDTVSHRYEDQEGNYPARDWLPLNDMNHSFEVLKRMEDLGFVWSITLASVEIVHRQHRDEHGRGSVWGSSPITDSVSLAICDAALKAFKRLEAVAGVAQGAQ